MVLHHLRPTYATSSYQVLFEALEHEVEVSLACTCLQRLAILIIINVFPAWELARR